MPGHKVPFNGNYITSVAAYRTDIVADDIEPPGADAEVISFPQGNANEPRPCRIGATNLLAVYMLLDGAGMMIAPRLWRIIDGVAYNATPATWGVANQSAMFIAHPLPAGDYVVTATGNFAGGVVHLLEQHTE